jgi:hypothetical protein
MKILLILLVVIAVLSCTKNNSDTGAFCWDCHLSNPITGASYYKDTCLMTDAIPHFTDTNGNDVNAYCTRK